MYRLLIVDDEPIITDGLFDLFEDIKEPEFDLYKAYSGSEALELMRKAKIDIVLSDICMPDINGLELQKEFNKQWPQCKVIFLTGFNDFNYIQDAIRNDSVDYILKTEGDEAILRAVNNAVSRIDKELRDSQYIQQAQNDRKLFISILGGKLLQDIAKGAPYSPEERSAEFAELEIPLHTDLPVLLLLGRVSQWGRDTGFTGKMKTLMAIQDVSRNVLAASALIVPVTLNNNYILWLIQPKDYPSADDKEDCWEKLSVYVQGCMDSLQAASRQIYDAPLALVAASKPVQWEKIGQNFDRLKTMLIKAGGISGEALLIDVASRKETAQVMEETKDTAADVVRARIKRTPMLKIFLENGQKDECLQLLGELLGATGGMQYAAGDISKELYYSISLLLLAFINENKLNEKIGSHVSLDALTNMDCHKCWSDASNYLSSLVVSIFIQNRDDSFRNTDRILRYVKNYVSDHICEDLSLTRISGLLHFNPSYFSRLFKSVTDMGYMEYVACIKTAKAKEMLSNSTLEINEIAEMLGFNAPSNFSRFFKKQADISPQEYRDAVQS